jgi:hypothetical protein
VRSQYVISANLYFLHLSLSSGTMPHHLMFQKQTPLMACAVGDPHVGTFTQCSGLIWNLGTNGPHPDWQDVAFTGRTHKLQ